MNTQKPKNTSNLQVADFPPSQGSSLLCNPGYRAYHKIKLRLKYFGSKSEAWGSAEFWGYFYFW